MGRPWEYSRWRRVLMQAVMWVVLAGTAGLAQWVVVERRRAPIALDAPVRLGPIWVRPPEDWSLTQESDPQQGILQYVDAEQKRELSIAIEAGLPGEDLSQEVNKPGAANRPFEFKGLHATGLLVERSRKVKVPQTGGWIPEELVFAITLLPSGHLIEVRLREEGGRLGTAESTLVETVANAITWAGTEQPKKHRPTRPTSQREFD